MKEWIVFRISGDEVCRMTLEGSSISEIRETVNLLAYTHNVDRSHVKVSVEERR